MSSAAAIDARVDNLRSQELQTSFHGIAARLDRLPSGAFQRRAMWLIGGVCFCDCLDMNVGGPIIAELLASGWSDAGLNSLFVSITAFGYLCGGLMAGMVSQLFWSRSCMYCKHHHFFARLLRCLLSSRYVFPYCNALSYGHGLRSCISCRL